MTLRRIRLCDEDQERYGGPEWLDTDAAIVWLSDLDEPKLTAIEKQIRAEYGRVLLLFLTEDVFAGTMAAFRGRTWLALLHNGVDIALADYTPKPMKMSWEPEPDAPDASPPSDGADSSPSPDEPAASPPRKTSRRSTAGSTRGSAKRTR
jgi:hypothetical protein